MSGALLALVRSQTTFAAERTDLGGDDEECGAIDEDRGCDGLEAVRLEGFELVELERSAEDRAAKLVLVVAMRVVGEPAEAPLDGSPGDPQAMRGLALTDAADHELEERRIEVGLLLPMIGAKGLPRETRATSPAAETRDGLIAALGSVGPVSNEEVRGGTVVKRAASGRAAGRGEHDEFRSEARGIAKRIEGTVPIEKSENGGVEPR